MKHITLMIMIIGFVSTCPAWSQEIERSSTSVDKLGEPDRLYFEGVTTFTAEEIRQSLKRTPEFLLASHPVAQLNDYLSTLQKLIETGYQHCGFPDANVSVTIGVEAVKVKVQVSEGPRYLCGDITIIGAKTLSTESLVKNLTKHRIKKKDTGKSQASEDTEKPIWQKDSYASFSTPSLKKMTKDIQAVLREQGLYFAQFTVNVQPEPGTDYASLIVTIQEEGARTLDKINLRGNKKNTREEILQYLELSEGMRLDHALVSKIEDRLWHSARFLTYSVTPQVNAEKNAIHLTLEVKEYEPAPRLSKPFSPEEKILLKLGEWLSDFPNRDHDLMCVIPLETLDIRLQIIISPSKGALVVTRRGTATQETDILNAVMLSPNKTAFFSPSCKTKFILPKLSSQILTDLSMIPNPDASDDKLFMITPAIGISDNKTGEPYRLGVKLAPVFFLSCAHKEDVDVTHLLDQGMMTFTGNTTIQIKLDTQSGQLYEVVAQKHNGNHLTFNLATGLFDELAHTLEASTSEHPNCFVPESPLSSSVGYLSKSPLLHLILRHTCEDPLPDSENDLPSTMIEWGTVLKQTISPLDQWFLDKKRNTSDRFKIPASDTQLESSPQKLIVSFIASRVFGISDQLLPSGSWPWTLAREIVYVAGGMGKYTQVELQRTFQSSQTGPIGYWATAKLLTYISQPLSRTFAAKGLEKLSASDFQNDWTLLMVEDHLLSQCLKQFFESLRSLEKQDLNSALAAFPPEQANLIRDIISGAHRDETTSLQQALQPVFEHHWKNGLKTRMEKALRTLASSTNNRQ